MIPVICHSRSVGGAAVLKTASLKGYAGSNPVCGVWYSGCRNFCDNLVYVSMVVTGNLIAWYVFHWNPESDLLI